MNISLSPFAPEKLVSRDGFGRPVPRQSAHFHTQAESGAYSRDSSRFPRRRPFIYTATRHRVSWKAMALKAEVWVEAVTEGGRRFMAAWREKEEDAARHRQEKRKATRLGSCNHTRKRRILRNDTHWPSRRVIGILVRTRDGPRPPA